MRTIPSVGVQVPRVLLPKPGIDLQRWAVIACDQFTSEPEYWQQVADLVGDAPSTYHMILPEAYLGTADEAERVRSVRQSMNTYLSQGLLVEHDGLILVERSVAGRTRHGLMLALDLDCYDYSHGSASLIRATEGTIPERLPPRVRIRSGAPLEVPHILVLIDDPEDTVIEPLVATRERHKPLYDTPLMLGSGHLTGLGVIDRQLEDAAVNALAALGEPEHFASRYGLDRERPVMLFAMGDGNHSLATAKAIWEKIKTEVAPDHPARWALVEVENIHDRGLQFEPIQRVIFGMHSDLEAALYSHNSGHVRLLRCSGAPDMAATVDRQSGPAQAFGIITARGYSVAFISEPDSNFPVGTLQNFLDAWGEQGGFDRIDYVHGENVADRLGREDGNAGFYVPAISKSDFFKTVVLDGALPRKTFSLGEAREKRFYMEARQIV